MKVLASLVLIFSIILAASASVAQEKKPQKPASKITQKEPSQPDTIQIIHRFVRGARLESQDAKNVSFTLKPTRAFITIEF